MVSKTAALMTAASILALSGTAQAGVIDISGQSLVPSGGDTIVLYNEASTDELVNVGFDLDYSAFGISWGSEVHIQLTHDSSTWTQTWDADTDFGWGNSSGNFTFLGSFSIVGGPTDASGGWTVRLWDDFDDGANPDGTFNQTSSITLTTRPSQIPEPGTLALLGMGLAGLGVASRRRRGTQA